LARIGIGIYPNFWKKDRTAYDLAKAIIVLMPTNNKLSVVDASMPKILKINRLEQKIKIVPTPTCVIASIMFFFNLISAETSY
jgi:hypothetical protein